MLATNLHHLKLVFVEDAAIEAKAYLGVYRPAMDYSPTEGGDEVGGGAGCDSPSSEPVFKLLFRLPRGELASASRRAGSRGLPGRSADLRSITGCRVQFLPGDNRAGASFRRVFAASRSRSGIFSIPSDFAVSAPIAAFRR